MKIAAELLICNSGDGKKLLGTYIRQNARLTDGGERRMFGSQNLFGSRSYTFFEFGECFGSTLIVR